MHVILWEYKVRPEHVEAFERIYSSQGDWAKLFAKASGYRGTELLRDHAQSRRYITIDRWDSSADFESFRSQWAEEYSALDSECQGLTETESLLGRWETVIPEPR